ncbi:response regulator transcription factor [Kiloniella sp.]|uniref:response regulator transcription factor n=1 Tax=Kiloniella sp. TaxID=1938587 RepID=UPI003B02AFAC
MYVYIIDDDDAVRESTQLLLESTDLSEIIKTFPSGDDFFSADLLGTTGCVLLDIRMPGMNGVDVLKKIKAEKSNLTVVMISGHGDIPKAVETMKEGAYSFIEKPFSDIDIINVVTEALSVSQTSHEQAELRQKAEATISKLTPREKEVLDKLVEGLLNKVIAYELGISTRTVEVHRARIMEKLEVKSLPEMVRLYFLAGTGDATLAPV